jgi:hypothetical protein
MLLLLLVRLQVSERWAYRLAGVLFSLMIFDIWDGESAAWLLALAAPLLILYGKGIGERLHQILLQPWSLRTVMPLVSAVVIIPAMTGAIDLVLRWMTP